MSCFKQDQAYVHVDACAADMCGQEYFRKAHSSPEIQRRTSRPASTPRVILQRLNQGGGNWHTVPPARTFTRTVTTAAALTTAASAFKAQLLAWLLSVIKLRW